jgi:hypothetical protein
MHKNPTRRQFFKHILSGALLAISILLAIRLWLGNPMKILRQVFVVKLDPSTPTGLLDSDELITITRLAQILVPPDASPGASKEWVLEHVNKTTESRPGYFHEYRITLLLS